MRRCVIFRSLLSNLYNQPLVDLDGNIYREVTIGSQKWIDRNFACTKYSDGSSIDNLTDISDWISASDGAYCWYNNDINYRNPFSTLYNWFALKVSTGYSDWIMPSLNAMNYIKTELYNYGVGGLLNAGYWSSSELNVDYAYVSIMGSGSSAQIKTATYLVRPIRYFTDLSGTYSLRDSGPAGGFIFHIDDTTVWEIGPIDLPSIAWSNVTGSLAGATAQQIQYSSTNTSLIISQAGFVNGAAKSCNDYSYGTSAGLSYLLKNGIEQSGWRIATKTDYDNLISYLGGSSVAGGKLKEKGFLHWLSPNTGATDQYKFKGVGSGLRDYLNGNFYGLQDNCKLWANTEYDSDKAYYYELLSNSAAMGSGNYDKNEGFAVRLVKDI